MNILYLYGSNQRSDLCYQFLFYNFDILSISNTYYTKQINFIILLLDLEIDSNILNQNKILKYFIYWFHLYFLINKYYFVDFGYLITPEL
jgi:hypothetical protein